MRVLCVAEKPSIARSITEILSGGHYEIDRTGRTSSYTFDYPRLNANLIVTYVAGHITELDFPETHRKWYSCDPFTLFDAPVEVTYPQRVQELVRNIEKWARRVDSLMIWTDCDREGEHIGFEIVQVAKRVNARIRVSRARFSAIIPQQIHHAIQNTVPLDQAQADAVVARQILDLRLGAAFTRMQCLGLQNRFGDLLDKKLISYGPCQFPTLGFVVSRYEQVKAFAEEEFFYIFLSLELPNEEGEGVREIVFNWKRGKLFDFDISLMLYEMVLEEPMATVTKVTKKNTKKWKPYPLTTVDLQKSGSRLLKMSAKQILDTADALYQRGILSYPRTETDQFDNAFDFKTYISKQTSSPIWGGFATRLMNDEGFSKPRKGRKNDKAHPPIHPTAYAGNLEGNEKKVYEYVVRRFLAACAKDAEGFQTKVEILVNGEEFSANGLLVLQRNYLEVFPYDKWSSHELPDFVEGQEFMPSVCELRDGKTTKPSLLTEADLVGLMDKNGIGTDATIAQHIHTIVEREYVMERMEGNTKHLVPSTLGVGLVHGYKKIGFEKSLSKPQLRRETERSMVQICERVKTKEDMLQESINQYKEVFLLAKRNFEQIVESVRHYVDGPGAPQGNNNDNQGTARRGRAAPRSRGPGGGDSDNDFGNGPPPAGGAASRLARVPPVNAAGIKCHCGVLAIERTSGKESTKGRKFWRCGGGVGSDCDFFQWVDTPPGRSISSSASRARNDENAHMVPAKRKFPEDKDEAARECFCKIPGIRRTVVKEGANKGRIFWKCSKYEGGCQFFEWDDEPPRGTQASTGVGFGGTSRQNSVVGSTVLTNTASGGGTTGECYKCHQVGHWANSCPNSSASTSEIPTAKNSSIMTSSKSKDDECYKCGKKGHWASSCPNPTPSTTTKRLRKAAGLDEDLGHSFTDSKGSSSSRSRSGPNSSTCYKCGQGGHFANNCTGTVVSSSRGRGGGRSVSTGRGKGRGKGSKKGTFAAADDW